MDEPVIHQNPLRSAEWPDETLDSLPLWDVFVDLRNARRTMTRLRQLDLYAQTGPALQEQEERVALGEKQLEEQRHRYEPELVDRIQIRVDQPHTWRED